MAGHGGRIDAIVQLELLSCADYVQAMLLQDTIMMANRKYTGIGSIYSWARALGTPPLFCQCYRCPADFSAVLHEG